MTKALPSIAPLDDVSSYDDPLIKGREASHLSHTTGLSTELLDRGRVDFIKFLESVKGQLTQEQYELILTGSLTLETLVSTSDKLHSGNVETKYLLLKRRYYVDPDGIVRDYKNNDSAVCEPDSLYDIIIKRHLENDHLHWRKLHKSLKSEYANITRVFVQMCTRYCSKCNPEELVKPFKKFKHANIYKGLMPLERVHVEIFSPFEELIEGRFSHVLYFRDYHSRFIWMLPLKSSSSPDISSSLASYLVSLPRLPIFLETTTLNRQEMFEICQTVALEYGLYIGLGLSNSLTFHRNGIARMQYLLRQRKEDCLTDWNMCLKHGSNYNNMNYNTRVLGTPNDLIFSGLSDYGKQFELKREKVIDELFAHNVVVLKNNGKRMGIIYVEDESEGFFMEDEEFISGDEDTQSLDQDKDSAPCMGLTPMSSPAASNTPGIQKRFRAGHHVENSGTQKKSRSASVVDMSNEISGPSSSFFQQIGGSLEEKSERFDKSVEL